MVLGGIDPPHLILLDEKTVGADADAFQAMVDKYPAAVVAALAAPVRSRTRGVAGADCLIEKPVEEGRLLRAVAWSLQLQDDVDDRAHGA